MTHSVWIIDDDASLRWVLERALSRAGYATRCFDSAATVMAGLRDAAPDAVITDIRMPGLDGLDLLAQIHTVRADLPVIVMTAHTDLDSAVDSYRAGAFEYLPKPFDLAEMLRLVARAVPERSRTAADAGTETQATTSLIGEAPAMQDLFRAIGRLANSHASVLICGETGTGKELVARALHQHSARAGQPLVTINTASVPPELLESELFGHERGAFTGAHQRRPGRFEQAHGGTLFLDEIGDMPAALQTRLLRVLAERRFYRVGGQHEIEVDVRMIAATHQDLAERVADGRFREDLYHRLNVIRLDLPALRERPQDIPALAAHFLATAGREVGLEPRRLTAEALEALCCQRWPGNVRELENVCRWLTVMSPARTVTADDLPREMRAAGPAVAAGDWTLALRERVVERLDQGQDGILRELGADFERVLLNAALEHSNGHKQHAAKRLGWGRNTLTRKLKELGIR